MMMTTLVHLLQQAPELTHVPATVHSMTNPFAGLTPDFGILGVQFTQLWQKVFAAAWACGIIWVGVLFVPSIVEFAQHKGGNHPQQLHEARSSMVKTGAAFAGLIALGAILAAVIKLVG